MVTDRQNQLKITEDKMFHFRKGIPGFEQYTEFVIIQHDEHFSLLQSVENEDVAFIIVDPFQFFSDYEFELSSTDLEELHIQDESEVAVRSIVTWGNEQSKITANLLAPLVFNVRNRTGKQVVLNIKGYATKHSLQKIAEVRNGGDGQC